MWDLGLQGIALDEGGDPNPRGKDRNAGILELDEQIPSAVRFTGLFKFGGKIDAGATPEAKTGLHCEGEGWVEFTGPFPLLTLAGGTATALLAGGFAGVLFNARPAQTWKG